MPIVVLVHYLLIALIFTAAPFDVDSTNKAEAKGAYEADPTMAFFQRALKKEWWIPRVVLVVIPAAGSFIIPFAYTQIANAALFGLLLIYAVVIENNYSLARDP